MARLGAHGTELGRLEFPSHSVVHMSNGHLLRDNGDGWKVWRRVKQDRDPRQVWENALRAYEEKLRTQPAYAEYRRLLFETAGSRYARTRLHMMLGLMPEDPDGIWSEIEDSYDYKLQALKGTSVEELNTLCILYRAAQEEQAKSKELVTL